MASAPLRASHRLMQHIVRTNFQEDKVDPRPEEFDLVTSVFRRAGGSWQRVFLGSVEDINLLKKTIKVAIKQKRFTKALNWEK